MSSEVKEFPLKKVTHCLVCRHPGSAKAHERCGCVFCDSEKFCQPQDYDSQCPCDWHRTEHARQASSIEILVKKKTLACDMFPFTEIIDEFLVPKDKAVNSFKWRKPNLLLMQNFALDKMEWPKHYTSEKVLVLMTYTELMNRSQGTESAAQIRPIRIYKRRVRNGVSCFEILWRKPDHYVFPEDGAPDDSDVVRSVEEENLFTVAFPDIVQLFHMETAAAKGNKLKKKKSKAEKEKPVDSSDGVSELFAQMSLQRSLHPEPVVSSGKGIPTQTVLECIPEHCTTSTLSTVPKPVKHSNSQELHPASSQLSSYTQQPAVLASFCHTEALSQAQSSLSISVVIDELHLSSIDWDALSFTNAPSPQSQHSNAAPQPTDTLDEENKAESYSCSTAVQSECCVESAASKTDTLCECSLMSRVHLRNLKICNQNNKSDVQRVVGSVLKSQKPVSENPKALPRSESGLSCISTMAPDCKEETFTKTQPQASLPVLAASTYTFVQAKNHNRQSKVCAKRINTHNVFNKSVCRGQDSVGEHSDVENQPQIERPSKHKANVKPKAQTVQKNSLAQKVIKEDRPKMFSHSVDLHHGSDSTTPEKQQHNMIFSRTSRLTQTFSTNSDDDDGDSDASICSPLPLAERLKLKFSK